MNIKELIEQNLDTTKVLREKLSQNAELSYKEYKTQEILMNFFDNLGISTKKIAGTGIVANLGSEVDCIALRADMDALPVNGISHACGHDYHMAVICGVALVLKELGYKKSVKFIFQPGEEAEGGALTMIEEGVLENPKVEQMVCFHVWPGVQVGTIEAANGPSMASVDDFQIIFKGRGGHAAMPHLCKNPLYPAMDFIRSINEKSRIEINPLDSHVITFASVQCGSAANVIADECVVKGTVRTFCNELRDKICQDMQRISSTSAENFGCAVDINYKMGYPPLINDEAITNEFITITKKLIGEGNVLPLEKTFAAEDFSYFAEKVPAVHFRLGIAAEGKGMQPLHSSCFSVSDDAIFYGIYIIVNYILAISERSK